MGDDVGASLTEAQQQLVLDHLIIASQIARDIKLPPRVERIDVYQSARYWLCVAATKCTPGRRFPAFARLVVKQNVIHDLRDLAFQIGPRGHRKCRRTNVDEWPFDGFEPRWVL